MSLFASNTSYLGPRKIWVKNAQLHSFASAKGQLLHSFTFSSILYASFRNEHFATGLSISEARLESELKAKGRLPF